MNFFVVNLMIYDGNMLYYVSYNNLFIMVFDVVQLVVYCLVMMKQIGCDIGNCMGILLVILMVLLDGEEGVCNLFNWNMNNDKIFIQLQMVKILLVVMWIDMNDWCMLVDLLDILVLEIGFLDGGEELMLLVQIDQMFGLVFINDVIFYKVCYIYGGNVLVDGFKGMIKVVVF